jgi:hypothetical protein
VPPVEDVAACVRRLADAPDNAKDAYSPVRCSACAKIHFIHNSTGKPLGEK